MTYKQLYDQAVESAKSGSRAAVAQLIAVTQAMQAQGPDAQVNQAQLAADATAILGKKSFKQAMEDTDAKESWESGKAQQLVNIYKDYDNPAQTYRQFMRMRKLNTQHLQEPTEMVAANMIAAAMNMQSVGSGAEADIGNITNISVQLMRQPAFKDMIKDPKTLELMKQGKATEMVALLAEKQNARLHRNDAYERIPSQKQEDAQILSDYLKSVAGTANAGAVEIQRKGKAYQEMIKQLQSAQTKMAQGIPLTGDESKALCDAVQKYNNNGQASAGGLHSKNRHYTQNMSLLKRFMPPKDFNAYCNEIKKGHPDRETAPENFIPGRINGKAKTAAEYKAEYKKSLQQSFSEENLAAICAINKMSKGDQNCVITEDRLKFETKKMMASGSAFHRTMLNAPDKKVLKDLSERGDMNEVAKEVQKRTIKHTVGTAQWYANRSAKALNGGRLNHHQTAFNLASMVAAGSLVKDAKNLSLPIDKSAFSNAVEATMNSLDFQRMVERYENDPSYRKNINANLAETGGANVSQELYKLEQQHKKKPQPQAQMK